MFNFLKTKDAEIRSLSRVIADLRAGIDERDQAIKDLESALAEERQKRVRLAERYMDYSKHSVPVVTIEKYARRY